MIRVLFICHGNICRSPMAEFVFKKMVSDKGLDDKFEICSLATSTEELGNPPYPPVRRILKEHGISWGSKTAAQIKRSDYDKFDMIIGMDHRNVKDLKRLFSGDPENKVSLFLDHAGISRDVSDPWYTGNFDLTWEDINTGCKALLEELYD